jgi:hypothetical protein
VSVGGWCFGSKVLSAFGPGLILVEKRGVETTFGELHRQGELVQTGFYIQKRRRKNKENWHEEKQQPCFKAQASVSPLQTTSAQLYRKWLKVYLLTTLKHPLGLWMK